jgi:hypothetical protein
MKKFLSFTFLFLLVSCNLTDKKKDKVWSELPEVTSLSTLKETEFAETLENPITNDKNTIYAPAFLFAWDKVEEELKSSIKLDTSNTNNFKLVVASKSYLNSLLDTEYSASAINDNGRIIAKAFFNKTLPFETKLQALDDPILFEKKTNVSAFGMKYFDEDAIKFSKILYYLNDEIFILQLTPKDKQHEIILIKGLENFTTLAGAIAQTNNLIEKGKTESKDNKQSWKYEIVEKDIFSIPTIKFNIATSYKNLVGQQFLTTDNKKHFIEEAYQRTGFILNENGAVVESAAVAAVDSASAEPIIKHPKSMIFDKPFLIVIKRKEQINPYFVMTINNAELLTKK